MRTFRGFTFIEVIVAIFFVGITLIVLQSIIQSSVLVRTARDQGIALAIVRNELESLRMNGYASLPTSGSFSDSLAGTLPNATTTLVVSDYNAKTKQVTASVVWRETGSAASSTVSLSTLITQAGGPP